MTQYALNCLNHQEMQKVALSKLPLLDALLIVQPHN